MHNPDVLTCLANLSNDEIFTPPDVANRMLDLLPSELWSDPKATFLDPCTKSGVFLREIAKRLMDGLATWQPDPQERINHILSKQLYGIAITELTSLMSRRTLYCSKRANSTISICTSLPTEAGNITYTPLIHTWQNGKCCYCGASQAVYDRDTDQETHAYQFIHTPAPETLYPNMKFDVIIGNPPYQLSDGGAQASAMPIYHLFVEQAKNLKPRFLSLIIPARWYSGGRGLDEFRNNMLSDKRLRVLIDYFNSSDCFPNIDLSGGICYFLWDREYSGNCTITSIRGGKKSTMTRPLIEIGMNSFVRFNESISVLRKVRCIKYNPFSSIVSSQKPFGFRTFVTGNNKSSTNSVSLYTNKRIGYVSRTEIIQNQDWVDKYKVYISSAYGERGEFPYLILGKPFLGEPNTCCTETFLVIGPYDIKEEAINVISYMRTRFFRFMVMLRKNTQHASRNVYSLVPLQDFSEPWTDEKLYAKYGLTDEEIAFIESMIRPMA